MNDYSELSFGSGYECKKCGAYQVMVACDNVEPAECPECGSEFIGKMSEDNIKKAEKNYAESIIGNTSQT